MKLDDVLKVRKESFLGRVRYIADILGFERDGKTRQAAVDAALGAVRAMAENAHRRGYVWSPSGRTCFVVHYSGGWAYDIVHPGCDWGGSCVCTGESYEDCLEHARRHAAGYED